MKILLSISAKAAQVTYKSLEPTEENSELIRRLRSILANSKIKGKLTVARVKGTTQIVLEKLPTTLQYENFLKELDKFKLEVKLVLKVSTAGKRYYEIQVPVKVQAQVKSEKEVAALKIRTSASKISPTSKDLHNNLNARSKPLAKVFGYWRMEPLKEQAKLPFPVAVEIPGYDKKVFMEALKDFISECKVMANKGYSPNRWNGANNGYSEYHHPNGWRMPEGALYYLSRGVPPTQEFYKVVTGKTNSKLPSVKNYSIK